MVELDLDQILETTETIVQELLATGEFGQCTFKDVLIRTGARLELPHGTLLQYKDKSTIKDLIKKMVLQANEPSEQILSPSEKRLLARPESGAGGKRTKRRKLNAEESDQDGSDEESEPKKRKKSSSTSKVKAKEDKVNKASKSESGKSGIKSAASGKKSKTPISSELVDSDIDDTDSGPSTSKPSASTSSPKKSRQKLLESDSEDDNVEASKSTKPSSSQKRPKEGKIPEAKDVSGNKSESELSVLFDDEPPKRRRKARVEKDETKPKGTKQKEKKGLPKDEETIKRLKSLVVACGVRKVWSREFKDLNSSSAQISRLKSILADLGMTGRMSMEQARAIKAKREFAQELEDVKDFEKKFIGQSEGRSSRRKLGSRSDVESSDDDEDEDEEDDKPKKRRTNARNSINAFLGDQSDED